MKKNNTVFLYNSTYKGDIQIDKNLNMKGKTTKFKLRPFQYRLGD